MSKKIDIDKEIERLKTRQPAILKCSHNTARRIKQGKASLDLRVSAYLRKLKIKPSDQIPDHIIFFCDHKGEILKMINLSERGRDPRKIVILNN